MFTIPIASIILLVIVWWLDELSRPYVVAGCVLVGVAGRPATRCLGWQRFCWTSALRSTWRSV